MITENYVFWVLKLDEIRELLYHASWVSFICVIISAVGIAFCKCDDGITKESADKYAPRCLAASIICAVLVIIFTVARFIIPSTAQMAMTKAIPAILNSDFADTAVADTNDIYRLGVDAVKKRLVEYVKQ